MISPSDRNTDRSNKRGTTGTRDGDRGTAMARYERLDLAAAGMGEAPLTSDTLFELGMMYASGRSVPADLVTAHKWFNLAAMKGSAEAIRLRREVAGEMTDSEIGQAQRAARDWLKAHPEKTAAPLLELRAAA
jgi:TPR repeat protein